MGAMEIYWIMIYQINLWLNLEFVEWLFTKNLVFVKWHFLLKKVNLGLFVLAIKYRPWCLGYVKISDPMNCELCKISFYNLTNHEFGKKYHSTNLIFGQKWFKQIRFYKYS